MGDLEFKPFTGGELDFAPIIIPPPDPEEFIVAGFPVFLNGKQFDNKILGGKNYVSQYPELLRSAVAHSAHANYYSDALALDRFYPDLRTIALVISPKKKFYPGMPVTFSDAVSSGKVYGVVKSYAKVTGEIEVSVQGFNCACLFGPVITLQASVHSAPGNVTTAYSLAQGGTGQTTPETALAAIGGIEPKTRASLIFDDFTGNFSATTVPGYSAVLAGSGDAAPYPKDADSHGFILQNRVGLLSLSGTPDTSNIVLKKGTAGRPLGNNGVSANTDRFECAFMFPTLGTGVDDYVFSAGMINSSSSTADIRDYGGFQISYSNAENSGALLITYGKDGSVSTFNTAVTVVAGTWYTFLATLIADTLTLYVNGVSITTVASSAIRSAGAADFAFPGMQFKKTLGSNLRRALVDYVYLERGVSR